MGRSARQRERMREGQHADFQKRLGKSSPTVFAVAEHFHCKGHIVQVNAVHIAPTAAEAEHYLDDGDLFVLLRYEVKHRPKLSFTCARDYKYEDVMVGRKQSVDRAGDSVTAYMIVNAARTHAAVINIKKTREFWRVGDERASNTNNIETFYFCPMVLVEFVKLSRFGGGNDSPF